LLVLTAIPLYVKFEISSFKRSRDIWGLKNPKMDHMTPPPHDLFDLILPFFASTHPSLCRIWSF